MLAVSAVFHQRSSIDHLAVTCTISHATNIVNKQAHSTKQFQCMKNHDYESQCNDLNAVQ